MLNIHGDEEYIPNLSLEGVDLEKAAAFDKWLCDRSIYKDFYDWLDTLTKEQREAFIDELNTHSVSDVGELLYDELEARQLSTKEHVPPEQVDEYLNTVAPSEQHTQLVAIACSENDIDEGENLLLEEKEKEDYEQMLDDYEEMMNDEA